LDFEHNSVPGSPTYRGEPVSIAGYSTLQLTPGEGVYYLMTSWTDDGEKYAAGGHYGDLSPVVAVNDRNEVIGLHSAALCRHGATPGLVFLSAAPAVQHKSATATHPSKSAKRMNPEDFQKALAKALGLADTATAEDILAALTAKLEASDAKADATEGDAVATKALSANIAELRALIKNQSDKLAAQDERIKLLSTGVESNEVAAILKQAATEGKQVPATAAKTMGAKDLRQLCAELPVTVPMEKRTPDATTLLLSSSTPTVNAEFATIDALTGVSDEDVAKYGKK